MAPEPTALSGSHITPPALPEVMPVGSNMSDGIAIIAVYKLDKSMLAEGMESIANHYKLNFRDRD